jgi:hypothetical protein
MTAAKRQIGNNWEFCVHNSIEENRLNSISNKHNATFIRSNQGKTL